jgi:hypothetical protein
VAGDPFQFVPPSCDSSPVVLLPPPSSPPRRRGRGRKRGHAGDVPAVPTHVSARLRSKEGPLFESVLDRAVRLKAQSVRASLSPAPPLLFRLDELLAMAEGCELPEVDVRHLAAAALVPDGAP